MFNIDIIYSNNTLTVNVDGIMNKHNINQIKKRIYYIINQYGINDIIIDIKNVIKIDELVLDEFLNDYDIKYGGKIIVLNR